MNQARVIEALCGWLNEIKWSGSLRVRCDHVTDARETLGLYLGSKVQGQGRTNQIAQVDILVCNEQERTVELIIEVDPNPNPKKLLGDVLPVLIADNYTPSNNYSPYRIGRTLVVFVTTLSGKAGSQKASQFQRIEEAVNSKLDLERLGVRGVRLCYGRTERETIERCQEIISREIKGGPGGLEPHAEERATPEDLPGKNPEPSPRSSTPIQGRSSEEGTMERLYISKGEAEAILQQRMNEAGIPLQSITGRCMFEPTQDSRGGKNCKLGRTPLWGNEIRLSKGKALRSEFMDMVERLVESGHKFQKAGRA